jgi:phospholipid/cholesterol/gamma-HCH transport system substrate-binding protein
MKKLFTKEVIIGLVTVISLGVMYWGLNYMKGINIFKPTNHYYVLMPSVSELQNSSPIFLDGFKVGVVRKISYEFNNRTEENIIVLISLNRDMKLQKGSHVELKSGLTSGAYLNLKLNKSSETYCQTGDTIKGISNIGLMDKLSAELLPRIETILPRLDSILLGIQTIVNHPALTQSLNHIEGATANLQKTSKQLNSLLANDIPDIVSNLNKVSSDFTIVSENMKNIDLQSIETILVTVDRTMTNVDQMTKQLNNPNNTLGLLLNDHSLYQQLDSAARNASNLLLDIKTAPKKYVHFSIF